MDENIVPLFGTLSLLIAILNLLPRKYKLLLFKIWNSIQMT